MRFLTHMQGQLVPFGLLARLLCCDPHFLIQVDMLLDAGADMEAETTKGFTALTAAACNGHAEIVKKLIDRGANWQTATKFQVLHDSCFF